MSTLRIKLCMSVFAAGLLAATPAVAQQNEVRGQENTADPQMQQISREWLQRLRTSVAGMMVFRDPVTGEFRAPEAGERAALVGRPTAAARTSAAPQAAKLPSGGLKLRMDPAKMDFLIVTKHADGSVSTGHAAAAAPSAEGGSDVR